MNKKNNNFGLSIIGFIFGSGLILIAILTESQIGNIFSGVCYGIGSASAALGLGGFLLQLLIPDQKTAELIKKEKIAIIDERNQMIRGKSAIMVNKTMLYMITSFIMLLSISGAHTWLVLLAVLLLIIQTCFSVFYMNYYDKRF